MKGVQGKLLRVNLTSRRITVEEPEESIYRTYLGGAGLVTYYMLKEIPRGADALSPQNVLIFAGGPMTGLGMAGATRNCVGAKSPQTNGYLKSEVGGFWPMDFKRAGYDALIVEGKASHPVYLWIDSTGAAEIRDASHLWGKDCLETQDTIAQEVGDKLVRTAAIGPGGEKMVRFACIMNDLKDAAGRGGVGAVMGSKNLKAVAVRGRRQQPVVDAARIREMAKAMAEKPHPMSGIGTGRLMVQMNEDGVTPTNNFAEGYFDGTAKITPQAIAETIRVGMEGCAACSVRCKKMVAFDEPWKVNSRNGGPEYESLGSLGSCCGVDDLKAIARANELCNLYSLDTISAGVVVAFGMECFENEILTVRDTGGIELRFGNAKALVQMIEMIAKRQGVGDLLAEGTQRAAEKLGQGAGQFAMHVKGVEIPMHEPRRKQVMGLTYAVEAQGADHMAGSHAFGPIAETKGQFKEAHVLALFRDSLICCSFLPYTLNEQVEIVRATTGWDYTADEAMLLGERIATLGRVFNLREGLTAADDRLPERFFSGTRRGSLKGIGIDRAAFQDAIHDTYEAMGWDRGFGVPKRETLERLGIAWAAEHLG